MSSDTRKTYNKISATKFQIKVTSFNYKNYALELWVQFKNKTQHGWLQVIYNTSLENQVQHINSLLLVIQNDAVSRSSQTAVWNDNWFVFLAHT